MSSFLTRTGSFLPGPPVANSEIQHYLGTLFLEQRVRDKVLSLNGIGSRHYALSKDQKATHDVYQLGALAAQECLRDGRARHPITYLSAGSTNAPLVGPGLASLLHAELSRTGWLQAPLEINSNSGICSSGAQAVVNAHRAVSSGEHRAALCLGVEQPSAILKSSVVRPRYDWWRMLRNNKRSQWFMTVFLRSMLSDGAGAWLLEDEPRPAGLSLEIEWTFSRSFANQTPLCMKLESRNLRLSQDVGVLSKNLLPSVRHLFQELEKTRAVDLVDYHVILPHLSSYYFERTLHEFFEEFAGGRSIPYWTNLATAGNTGSASIFIMLDEYLKSHELKGGERLLLFIPESGQFNFVLLSLRVVSA